MEALKNQRFTAMHNQEIHAKAAPERELQVASTCESSSKRRTFTKPDSKIGPLELTFWSHTLLQAYHRTTSKESDRQNFTNRSENSPKIDRFCEQPLTNKKDQCVNSQTPHSQAPAQSEI